ncbi:MAG TPA: hypothetical protein VGP08_06755 [Pyrinomonadaceae bacterium]|jgi:hypothetical protein|nr:hypothetical protein [Pyrinomonadaceae bacterium]
MKCQEFQSNVDGLARGALSDARTRDAAAAHEEECGACAGRLADERALTAGLRALAASMREAEAPARAESALLSAFRSRDAAAASVEGVGVAGTVSTSHAPSNPSNPSNVVALSEHAGAKQWSWIRTVAVAAMAAAAVALFMLVPPYLSTPAPPAPRSVANNTRVVPVQTQGGVGTGAGQKDLAQSGEGQDSPSSKGEGSTTQKLTDERVAPVTSTQRRGVVRATNASYGVTPHGVTSNRGTASQTADADEITTEFIQLAGFTQSEGVHLVRVELPRSALASFGIPVNADRAGGRVKADVLLGEDGTARAIRFVR